jgi:hypothetical protein
MLSYYYQWEHNIVYVLKSRREISFLSSGHWFVGCKPQQRHYIRRNPETHLQLGLVSLYGACPVCLAHRSCGLVPVTVRMTFDLTQKRCPLTALCCT